ncbi:acetyl-CoA carboxylase biotin carboxyl carrier protein [Acidaminobacterium chupaoyuni]
MKETDIRKYAGLMQELGLTGLEITEDNKVVRLERTAPPVIREAAPRQAVENSLPQNAKTEEQADYISVRSPIVGIFYASPAENAEAYVSVGERVEPGKTLCIIEAMKLMNEIAAEESGVIAEICAADGQIVEYGTELFRIKR